MTTWTPTPEQVGTILSALEDASDYRGQQGDCADCLTGAMKDTGKCADHQADDSLAAMYDLLRKEIQEAQP